MILLLEVILKPLNGERSCDVQLIPVSEALRDSFNRSHEDRIVVFILSFNGRFRFRENPKRKREIHEGVLHISERFIENILEDFNAYSSNHHCSRCSECWDDLTSDNLNLEVCDFLNFIVASSEICNSCNEFNVPVRRVVLLELDRAELERLRSVDRRDLKG